MKFDALSNALSKEVVGAESTEAATASVGVAVGAGALGIAISEAAGVVDAKRMPAPFRRRRLVVEDGKGVFALGNGPLLLERSGLALMERVDEKFLADDRSIRRLPIPIAWPDQRRPLLGNIVS